jgi:hypothetical protein
LHFHIRRFGKTFMSQALSSGAGCVEGLDEGEGQLLAIKAAASVLAPLPGATALGPEAGAVAAAPAAAAPAAASEASPEFWSRVLPAMVAWNAASVTVILYNKYLYLGAFPHPITLVLLHMVANTLLTQVLAAGGLLAVPALGWETYLQAVPSLSLLFAGSLACSNLSAARLSVATVQMIKALAPLLTVATMFALGSEVYGHSLLTAVLLMSLGVGVASFGEANFDGLGFALQIFALVCESLRMVLLQRTIQASLPRANPLAALALFAPVCAALLLPLSLHFEPGALVGMAAAPTATHLLLLGNAAAACALNGSSVWLLSQQSGPLLLTLVGVVKDIELIVFSVFLFSSSIRYLQVAGYAVALLGINMYQVLKAPGGKELSVFQLARAAATNQVALTMGLGVLGILLVARK